MTFLVDSSVLIAYADKRDGQHSQAVTLLKRALKDKEFGKGYVSDYVFDEVLTYTYGRTKDKRLATEIGEFLLSTEFELIHTPPNVFQKSWERFQKTTGLSFTDCILAELIKVFNIQRLLSFDSGFDQLGIHRIE